MRTRPVEKNITSSGPIRRHWTPIFFLALVLSLHIDLLHAMPDCLKLSSTSLCDIRILPDIDARQRLSNPSSLIRWALSLELAKGCLGDIHDAAGCSQCGRAAKTTKADLSQRT